MLVASGADDGHGRYLTWLKWSSNDRGNTSCYFIEESISKCIAPLQVRDDKGSNNRLIAKHVVMVRNGICRRCIGGRSTNNTQIERFWRECNVNVMIHFRNKFERLESLGHIDPDHSTDLWSMHYILLQPQSSVHYRSQKSSQPLDHQ